MKIYNIILFLLVSLLGLSCNKNHDLEYYIPKVEMVSATILPDGRLEFVGRLIEDGHGEIEYLGFCADTSSTPRIHENQVMAQQDGSGLFTVQFESQYLLHTEEIIYVNAFAAGNYTFTEGSPLILNQSGEVVFQSPCEQPPMTLTMGNTSNITSVSSVVETIFETQTFSVGYGAGSIKFFCANIIPGVYEMVGNNGFGSLEELEMNVSINYLNGLAYYFYSGQEVYVSRLQGDTYEIEFCNASYSAGQNVSMKFTIDYP